MSKIVEQIASEAFHSIVLGEDIAIGVARALEGRVIKKSEYEHLQDEARQAAHLRVLRFHDSEKHNKEQYLKTTALESQIAELNGQLAEAKKKPVYTVGLYTIRNVAEQGQFETPIVDFVAADDIFHKEIVDAAEYVPKNAFANAAQYGINQDKRAEDLAAKLWDTEQELNSEKQEHDRVTDEWETLVDNLQADLIHARREIVNATIALQKALGSQTEPANSHTYHYTSEPETEPFEHIEPPACLNPTDAVTWTTKQFVPEFNPVPGWISYKWNYIWKQNPLESA